ncbi:MAG: amidohydrolase [Flavitalea sp.]
MKESSPSLSISLIQANLHWENKQANLDMFEEKIKSFKERTEVAILPEMFSTGFSMNAAKLAEQMEGPTLDWMERVSAENKIILTGSLIIEEQGEYFNRLIWMLPTGDYGHYDKRHLFGYAGEDKIYTAGSKRLISSVKGWKINLQVCYDLRFPVWARQSFPLQLDVNTSLEESSAPEYDLLVYVANWPERRIHAWKTLLQARAIENQCYVAGVNRTGTDGNDFYYSGDSMIIDPMGEVLKTVSHEESIISMDLNRSTLEQVRNKLPFLKDADNFMIGH